MRMNEGRARSGRRRRFDDATKRRILAEYEAAVAPGSKKALLDREGLSRSHIALWRKGIAGGDEQPSTKKRRLACSEPLSRDTAVEAAIRLLNEDPDDPLTMAKVAKEAGVAPMSLYRHFRNRTEMLNEVAWALAVRNPNRHDPGASWKPPPRLDDHHS